MRKLRVIITGATGMVGEGVLHECILHPDVEKILVVGRKPCGYTHEKLKEIIIRDFFELKNVENQFKGYNACFFCLGVSSVGMKKSEYFRITYELTIHFAHVLVVRNPDMTFCYISGAGTDSTGKSRLSWARVKGRTENELFRMPFHEIYTFRPSFMLPTKGLKNALSFYKYVTWMFPAGRRLFPGTFGTLRGLGLAMIYCAGEGYSKKILDGKDISAIEEKMTG